MRVHRWWSRQWFTAQLVVFSRSLKPYGVRQTNIKKASAFLRSLTKWTAWVLNFLKYRCLKINQIKTRLGANPVPLQLAIGMP